MFEEKKNHKFSIDYIHTEKWILYDLSDKYTLASSLTDGTKSALVSQLKLCVIYLV